MIETKDLEKNTDSLRLIADHEECESYIEWLGEEFDPEYFNKNEINELLGQ